MGRCLETIVADRHHCPSAVPAAPSKHPKTHGVNRVSCGSLQTRPPFRRLWQTGPCVLTLLPPGRKICQSFQQSSFWARHSGAVCVSTLCCCPSLRSNWAKEDPHMKPLDGISALTLILIASFAIDRVTTWILLVLSA